MTPIDILFWLLVALMGGVAWAIEAGLASRHRNVLCSTVLASLASGVIIMFWVEDKTSIERTKFVETKKKGGGQAQGTLETGNEDNGKDEKRAKPQDGQASAASSSDDGSNDGKRIDLSKPAYNRTPFKDCPACPDLVIVPEGTFRSGSAPEEIGRTPEEATSQETTISKPFAIGRLELLRGEFNAFAKETSYTSPTQCNLGKRRGQFNWRTPGFEQDDRHAVVCLTTDDVQMYLGWLSRKTGRQYRLPTEIEWEYAARGKTTTPYATGETLHRHQGNFGRSRDGTAPAGSFEMNGFGLSDMAGSVWELTSDCKPKPEKDITTGCDRMVKGGGWNSPAATARHAARAWHPDGTATNFIGLRVVRPVDERDNDKLLDRAERIALIREEKLAAEIKAKELAETEKAKVEARDQAAKIAENAAIANAAKAAAAAKAKADAAAKAAAPIVPAKK